MTSSFPVSCCSIALRDQPIENAARQIASAGFEGIEIWYPHIEKMGIAELSEVHGMCEDLGLRVPVIAPYFSFTRDLERCEISLQTAGKALIAARALGAKKIRTFIDCGENGLSSSRATEQQWKMACSSLKKLCRMDPSTEFIIETHEKTLADSLPSVRRLLDGVAETNLKINYQANANFLHRGFLSCLDALYPAVTHMHWEQVRTDGSSTYLEEEGQIDFAALVGFLQDRHYQGTASVEYCWMPVESGRIESAHGYLDGLFSGSVQNKFS